MLCYKWKKICVDYKITIKNGLYLLKDIVTNILKVSDASKYIYSVKNRVKVGHEFYIKEDHFIEMLNSCKNSPFRYKIHDILNGEKIDKTDNVGMIDIEKRICKFNNINIKFLVTTDDDPWFQAIDVARVLGYSKTNDAIRINVQNDDKLTYGEIKKNT